ncbi:LiaI-LiaF-like domain-containing protein [Lederbergia ruris]|uniref:LiaI-LiaF-like transmembrane region domain-containing protein n=1 Tax=Lederbergia ruris TaxID=217495 RepID=A0ABQ4KFR5_9BACI|nr:DUF5668 domain-containing protein [Lederbergia ruris]GIN55944.1 hypothetical protein J8TS2_02630 [Lederbergia ruris]
MKKPPYLLSGMILFGFGIYFLLQYYHFSLFHGFYSWPTLFVIVGIAFLINGYAGKDYPFIFPGVLLTGMGIHFHIAQQLDTTIDISGIFLLLISIGLLLTYVKTGNGLFQGILFLAISLFLLFIDKLKEWMLNNGHSIAWMDQAWPYLLMVFGLYFLFFHKRK